MKTFFCGPESFTPDLGPIVGEAPELRNYFVAAGLNSIGILSGPGIGRVRPSRFSFAVSNLLLSFCCPHLLYHFLAGSSLGQDRGTGHGYHW